VPSWHLRLQEGETVRCEITAPTLRRSIGLFGDATVIDALLLSFHTPVLENGLTLAGLSTRVER